MRLSPQIILVALESSKISVLLGALDLNPDVGQKTVIITNSAQEVEDVFQVKKTLRCGLDILLFITFFYSQHPTICLHPDVII